MTAETLLHNGFKKKTYDQHFWFELKKGNHLFLTNDTTYNRNTDVWHLGYQNLKTMEDPFWFNKNLVSDAEFKIIFHMLTGIEFKLAHQRNLIK